MAMQKALGLPGDASEGDELRAQVTDNEEWRRKKLLQLGNTPSLQDGIAAMGGQAFKLLGAFRGY
jgi:hypothetical protein